MITFIYDEEDNLITDLVNTAILTPDIIKVKNRLLDGTYHVQSIGDNINNIDIICYVDKVGKSKLDNHYIIDKPIKLVKEDKYYIGLISEINWDTFSKDLYEGQFILISKMEGSI